MTWMDNPENHCKAQKFGARNSAMWRELMSSLALAMLLATGAVADESSPRTAPPGMVEPQTPPLSEQFLAPPRPRGPSLRPPACAARTRIVAELERKYREFPISLGLQSNGLLLEIFATADGSTWTAVTTSAQTGDSCIVAAGAHWTSVPAVAADTGDGL